MMGMMNEPFLAAVKEQQGEGEDAAAAERFPSSAERGEKAAAPTTMGSVRPPRIGAVRRICRALVSPGRASFGGDELRRFQRCLLFLGLDQSTKSRLVCSWIVFVQFTVVVPVATWVYVSCENCDADHSHPFQLLVDCSESALGAVSFLCLTSMLGKYGLNKVLCLDKLDYDQVPIRCGYETQLRNAFRILAYILVPCLVVELVHKTWWYICASVELPFLARDPTASIILCAVNMLAWLYKSSIFLFMCLLFRLMCSLQLLRLQGYIKLLEGTSNVSVILREHMRIRDQLLMISHRYRNFVILSMLAITCSQLSSLFEVTDSRNLINFFRAGDLVVCSVVQLSGFVLCLHGAAKITHRAQRIMSIVSQWHALATCNPNMISQPNVGSSPSQAVGPAHPLVYNKSCGDLENAIMFIGQTAAAIPHDIEAFQERQALMGYLQFANAGISLYGFVLDRGFLFAVFGLEFSLTLFILGKTILTH